MGMQRLFRFYSSFLSSFYVLKYLINVYCLCQQNQVNEFFKPLVPVQVHIPKRKKTSGKCCVNVKCFYTVTKRNDTLLVCCDFHIHQAISVILGINVAETVTN